MGDNYAPFLFLVFLLCSVLYFYQYRLLDIYFILGYNPVLHFIKIISVWLLGALSIDFCVPLINLHQLKFLIFFLNLVISFQYQKFYRFTLYTFCLGPRIIHFSIFLESGIRNQDLGPTYVHFYLDVFTHSADRRRKGNKCVYTNLFLICILICFYIHI